MQSVWPHLGEVTVQPVPLGAAGGVVSVHAQEDGVHGTKLVAVEVVGAALGRHLHVTHTHRCVKEDIDHGSPLLDPPPSNNFR